VEKHFGNVSFALLRKGRKEWSPGDYQVFISSVMAQVFPGRTKDNHGKSQLIEIIIKFLRKK
jgi:hypothetical protein